MRRLFSVLCTILIAGASSLLHAQEYPQIVSMESINGGNATFLSTGVDKGKNESKENAVKSLFYTLLFQGVEGVNDGKPLACQENSYTKSFFDYNERYKLYVNESKEESKPSKAGNDKHKCIMRVSIRLSQLTRDVQKNTCKTVTGPTPAPSQPTPTVIVVPYKKDGESYKQILENDYDRRVAVDEVKKGFNDRGIRTMDLMSHIISTIRRGGYEENAGAAESNDKTLLTSSNADVYVVVDFQKESAAAGNRVELRLHAYDVATNADWGSQTGGSKNYYRTASFPTLCRYAVSGIINPFLNQIQKYYSEPTRVSLQVSLSGDMGSNMLMSLQEPACESGDCVADFIMYWLDDNAHNGDYHLQGVVDEQVIFDYIMIPNVDKKGRKMNPLKFLSQLKKALKEQGIDSTSRIETGAIILTVSKGF